MLNVLIWPLQTLWAGDAHLRGAALVALFAGQTITRRQAEVIIYMHVANPLPPESIVPSFFDFQMTGPRMAKRRWTEGMLPTICGSSKFVMRLRLRKNGPVHFRHLSGFELMRAIGWDDSFYTNLASEPHKTLCSLAGNAYSGFALSALLVSFFAVYSKLVVGAGSLSAPSAPADPAGGRATSEGTGRPAEDAAVLWDHSLCSGSDSATE